MSSSFLIFATPSPIPAARKFPALGIGSKRTDLFSIRVCNGNGRLGVLNSKSNRRGRGGFCCKSQLAELAPATSAAYGLMLLGGGLFAFTKSGSKGSLFGGLTGGALMTSAYVLMQAPETKAIGDALGFGSAFLFSFVFGIRLAATRKPIPAGLLLGLSLCALTVFSVAYLQDNV
ncbi:protein FATTY ACID EXPORT 4, chloroplastic [Carica papaya]|uniref:protein FATTY ACID EXPORT 4, chloroplastic n=1 Tax=Carica papaya TaxID=3649 RepID=UPI000B8CD809|nr:protein FATTY ACID EXPORT 4, chloroplastic [Carica papaya]